MKHHDTLPTRFPVINGTTYEIIGWRRDGNTHYHELKNSRGQYKEFEHSQLIKLTTEWVSGWANLIDQSGVAELDPETRSQTPPGARISNLNGSAPMPASDGSSANMAVQAPDPAIMTTTTSPI